MSDTVPLIHISTLRPSLVFSTPRFYTRRLVRLQVLLALEFLVQVLDLEL